MKKRLAIYGNRVYLLDYERLTEHQVKETRDLIKYIGLACDEACLSPEKNTTGVQTVSQLQVKKVYKGSSNEW